MFDLLSKYIKGDRVIWIVILFLSILSLLAVYSSTGTLAYKYQHGNTVYYFMRHLIFMAFGFMVIFITHLIHYKYYSRLSQLFLIISIPLLLITLTMGKSINEATRWITLPVIGITMQTSDFAKLALIMYVARMLSIKQDKIKDLHSGFMPIIIPVAVVCMLILPANFSTAAILFVTSLIIMFIGRVRFKYLFVLISSGVLVLAIFIAIVMNTGTESRVGTWKNRIESYLGGDTGDNYQVEQAKIAVASGGLIGRGPGNSIQRDYLPHPYSDFIYAIIIEEYGLIGGMLLLFLYLYLLYRAGLIVRKCNRTFPAFLAIGLSIMLVFQGMINMAVAVNLLPVTGQTLPFVSMGGSSLLFSGISIGIILSISREVEKQEIERENPEHDNQVENEGEE